MTKDYLTISVEDYLTISVGEYRSLSEAQQFLDCLEACGVDNWDGYGDAVDMYENDLEEEEDE